MNEQRDNRPNNNNNSGNRNPNNKNGSRITMLVAAAIMILLMVTLVSSLFSDGDKDYVEYSEFLNLLEENRVNEVQLNESSLRIIFTLKAEEGVEEGSLEYRRQTSRQYYTNMSSLDTELIGKLETAGLKSFDIKRSDNSILMFLASYVLPILLMVVFFSFLMRRMGGSGGGVMGVGKSNAKRYDMLKDTGVTFKDVAGQDEAKESLVEIVDFLHNPGKYSTIGAKLPKGALLVGPPGTGKTLLAKAVAGEAKVPFFSLAGSDFVEMFVGVGASRVRDLFKKAQENAPCIIFIDEIDAIGKSRDSRFGGNDEREQTLNQLLSEMDGFDSSKGVFILAATNRPDVLDKALLRPGRLDRRIIVDKPDLKGRVAVLKVHAKKVNLDETVDLDAIALATSGAVGSDLANMINEAAINAVKQGRRAVSQKDLFEAVEVVLVGKEKKDRIMSERERRIVSYHEVGHALVSALQKDAEPVQKITIVPRTMGALGYVMNVPEEEKYLNTEAELRAMLVQFLAGRAAEELVFDTVTTGAANDIERATAIAKAMVTQYGMSERFGLMGLGSIESQYLEGRTVLNCADETAADVDKEVMEMLKISYDKAKQLLSEHREALDKIAEYLIEKETITGKEFMRILREIEPVEPASESAETVPEPAEPASESVETVSEPAEPASKSAETVSESAGTVSETAETASETAEVVSEPSAAVDEEA